MSEPTAESLHRDMLKSYGGSSFRFVDAGMEWLVEIDLAIEPPLITLTEPLSNTVFILDGCSISRPDPIIAGVFIEPEETVQAELTFLNRLFGS